MTKWKEHIYINIDMYLLKRNVNAFMCSIIVSTTVTCHLTKTACTRYQVQPNQWLLFSETEFAHCTYFPTTRWNLFSIVTPASCHHVWTLAQPHLLKTETKWKRKTKQEKNNTSQNLQLLYFSEHLLQFELWIMQLPSPSYLMLQAGVFKHQWKRLDMLSSQFIATP